MTDFVPPGLALLAAAMFGMNVHLQQKGLDTVNAVTGAFLSVAAMACTFWLLAPFFIEWKWWFTPAAFTFAVCGLFFPALGQRLSIASIRNVGPALTSAIGSFVPVFAVLPAIILLNEKLNLQGVTGLLIMIGGLLLAGKGQRGLSRSWPLWFLLLPLGAAASRGIAQPIIKTGLLQVPSPFFAGLVLSTVSAIVLAGFALASNAPPKPDDQYRGRFWFLLSGVINGLGVLALSTALKFGSVTTAAPLAATTPLWALLFGAFVFKRETLTWHHALIALFVLIGAVLILTR